MNSLPETWTVEPFSQVARYSAGRTPARANPQYWTEGRGAHPWISISDMTEFGQVSKTKETITDLALADVFRGRVVPAGTLLMSFKLTIGRVATLSVPACHNEAIISIYPRKGIDQRYLAYYLAQFNYDDLQDRAIKGQTLNQDKIDRIPVVLPPSDERSAIADVLDLARAGIASEERAEAVANKLKAAAMCKLFKSGLLGEPQKESEIGLVPASWEVGPFENAREWLQYGTSERCTAEPDAYPVLRIPNIQPGAVNPTDLKYCGLPIAEAERYLLQDGDLIFIRTNGVLERLGACAVYRGQPRNALFASYLIRARLKNVLEPRFVAYFYESDLGNGLVASRATPAADGKYNLNTSTIDSLPLAMPSTLNEQREIVAILDAIDRKIDLHRRKRALLDELFKALLHRLMTGKVRVSDLDLSALPAPLEARP